MKKSILTILQIIAFVFALLSFFLICYGITILIAQGYIVGAIAICLLVLWVSYGTYNYHSKGVKK